MAIEYSEDRKTIVGVGFRGNKEIDVSVVQTFVEAGLTSSYELERLFEFYRLSQMNIIDGIPTPPKEYSVEDLVDADLTGCILRYFYANWEDSETLETTAAAGIIKDEWGGYKLVWDEEYSNYLKEYEAWEDAWSEDSKIPEPKPPAGYHEELENFGFSPGDTFVIIWPDGVEKLGNNS